MKPHAIEVSFVQQISIFKHLSHEVHEMIAASIQLRHFKKGQIVFLEGDAADKLYIVVRGRVRIYQSLPDGREYTLEHLGPGNLLAIVSLFDGGPYPASAVTLERCTLGILFYQDLKRLMDDYPEVAKNFLQILSERMRRAHQKSTELALRTVHERLASTLLSMYEQKLAPAPATELGRLIGSARETVTRALHDFERHGAIDIQHGRIQEININKLRSWLGDETKEEPHGKS